MSKIRKNYEKSFAYRLKQWVNGDLDIADAKQLEVQIPEKKEPEVFLNSMEQETLDDIYDERRNKLLRRMDLLSKAASVVLCVVLIAFLLVMVADMPGFGDAASPVNNEVAARYIESGIPETGAVNFVTGMILDYRAFDTFGESNVLFIACICVQILLRLDKKSKRKEVQDIKKSAAKELKKEPGEDLILQKVSMVLVPLLFVFGIYIILNGHLSPGGGFSGGSVLGAALILYLSAFGYEKTEKFFSQKTFKAITLSALSFYCLAKSYSFFTGANHLESGIPLGTPGNILSSGLILPLNICVGLVVACTMYGFYTLFRKGDF
ncbi:MAG: hypothetical protein MJ117_02445 [Lachnospiraceae bacterium]|nr:hypothetical protein [Lachnospiraceae bacterium]